MKKPNGTVLRSFKFNNDNNNTKWSMEVLDRDGVQAWESSTYVDVMFQLNAGYSSLNECLNSYVPVLNHDELKTRLAVSHNFVEALNIYYNKTNGKDNLKYEKF